MTINRDTFFAKARAHPFAGTLTRSQVDGINAVLNEWDKRGLTDRRWLAYMLATDKWETNATMQAVKEAYWLSEEWRRDHLRYYPYYGRGLVQLTWEANYATMGKLLHIDLVRQPELALKLEVAVQVLFEGMLKAESKVGDFTGVSLENYFNDTKDDPVNARRIINGTDKAEDIAAIHRAFLEALT